jgi:hypothetical protein
MNASRFDRISKLFAERHLSRRQAIAAGALAAAGLRHAAAQDATPEAVRTEPWTGDKTMYLFVQSFHGGSITPTEGQEGRYTVTLHEGTGQTIYFGDRPSRDVGTTPTPQFLEGLGFPEENPPNAALIMETEAGETDIAVVELFNPTYDPTSRGVTYDVEVLENWQEDLELGLREEPTDLAALAPAFGTAHLLIDDCPQLEIACQYMADGHYYTAGAYENVDGCWNYAICMPCEPYGHEQPDRCATYFYWNQKCNENPEFAFYCQDPRLGGCFAQSSYPFFGDACFG